MLKININYIYLILADFFSIIKNRRSVRVFQEKEVERDLIKKAIEMAAWAPSACDIQGWKFIVVDDKNKKQQIVDLGGSINIRSAPAGILVLYDNRSKDTEYADYIQSASAAIQNLLLTVHYLGLGACWICHLPPKRQLRKLFKIPGYLSPIAYIIVGYKKNEPVERPRKYSLEEIVSFNTFSSGDSSEKTSRLKLFILRILVRFYYLVPVFIKKKWLNQYVDGRFVKKFN